MGLNENGIRVGVHQTFQFHEMKRHLEQPLFGNLRKLVGSMLPIEILHRPVMMLISIFRTGLLKPLSVPRYVVGSS